MTDITLTTTTTLYGGSIEVTLYEDVGSDGDGSSRDPNRDYFDNSATVSLSGGADETNVLSGFEAGRGNDYWIEFQSSPGLLDDSSPSVDSISADVPVSIIQELGATASMSVQHDSTVTESPSVTASASVSSTNESSTVSESPTISATSSVTGTFTKIEVTTSTFGSGSLDSTVTSNYVPLSTTSDLTFEPISDPISGHRSNWIYEDSSLDDPTAFSISLNLEPNDDVTIYLQHIHAPKDSKPSSDAPVDHTTEPRRVDTVDEIETFDELGDDGWYRVLISGVSPDTLLRSVALGPTRY